MMDQAEIAWLLLQLMQETRTYRGVSFACHALDAADQIRYAKGLLRALPDCERLVVEASFERISSCVAAARLGACHATHAAPGTVQ